MGNEVNSLKHLCASVDKCFLMVHVFSFQNEKVATSAFPAAGNTLLRLAHGTKFLTEDSNEGLFGLAGGTLLIHKPKKVQATEFTENTESARVSGRLSPHLQGGQKQTDNLLFLLCDLCGYRGFKDKRV